jgi:DNA mismatch repair ATPase MutS
MLIRDTLEQLVAVFKLLETFPHPGTPQLAALCRPFLDAKERPSVHLRRVNRIVNATGIRGNPLFWLTLNAIMPWDYYFAYRLDQRKEALARHMPAWLAAWYELEAASSLANLAYLNPAYTFPGIVEAPEEEGQPVFAAQQMGHPLIPDERKVCNDFAIPTVGQINLITGSNMSGKSTFLRTVGVNLILAYAGGPVNAARLMTKPFRMASCIRISDSVTDGISYFYAEVKCLKALLLALEGTDARPVFYFIDEIFRGTNNRERLLGSRAYIRALAQRPGVGLIATHDLELVQLADETPAVSNYHFTDAVEDGRMIFDFTIRPGPSPTTNALKIMRLEGLPV